MAIKIIGICLSGIGGVSYLIWGIFSLILGETSYYGIGGPISYLLTGITSIVGIIIALKQVKLGGTVILIAIPFAILVATLITLIFSFNKFYYPFILLLLPYIPNFPNMVFVLIGGILCRISSD